MITNVAAESATTSARARSCKPLVSLIIAAPAAMAARATVELVVSTDTTTSDAATTASITGTTRSISAAGETAAASGENGTAPISTNAAPASAASNAAAMAFSSPNVRPPS